MTEVSEFDFGDTSLLPSPLKRSVCEFEANCDITTSISSEKTQLPFSNQSNNNDALTPNKNLPITSDFSQIECEINEKIKLADLEKIVVDTLKARQLRQRPITPVQDESNAEMITSPITPTANLKMLMSAVSPELRNREKRKEMNMQNEDMVKEEIFNEAETRQQLFLDDREDWSEEEDTTPPCLPPSRSIKHKKCSKTLSMGEGVSQEGYRGSRKEKSLGLLCHKFISKYPMYPDITRCQISVGLDEIATDLAVERRRIYDIVNVLESLEIMSRMAKNRYVWHGKVQLVNTLCKLKIMGESDNLPAQINEHILYEKTRQHEVKKQPCLFDDPPKPRGRLEKEKSLGVMSQRFLMLFLVSPEKAISLDVAAKILISEQAITHQNSQFKTKIRRLYDIANIFTSLELIRKVQVAELKARKPAFKYIGPQLDGSGGQNHNLTESYIMRPFSRHSLLDRSKSMELYSPLEMNRGLARHASFDQVCAVAEKERTKLVSVLSKTVSKYDFSMEKGTKPAPCLTRGPTNNKTYILLSNGSKTKILKPIGNSIVNGELIYISQLPNSNHKQENNKGVFTTNGDHISGKRFVKVCKPSYLNGINRILTPIYNRKSVNLIDASTQSSPLVKDTTLKSINENTPGNEDMRICKSLKRSLEDSGYESDVRIINRVTPNETKSETIDVEVAGFSQRCVKRKLDERRQTQLRALHLQPEFCGSPVSVKLPKIAHNIVRKDLSCDFDLATPLPVEGLVSGASVGNRVDYNMADLTEKASMRSDLRISTQSQGCSTENEKSAKIDSSTSESSFSNCEVSVDSNQSDGSISRRSIPTIKSDFSISCPSFSTNQSDFSISCQSIPTNQSDSSISCQSIPTNQSDFSISSPSIPTNQSDFSISCRSIPTNQSNGPSFNPVDPLAITDCQSSLNGQSTSGNFIPPPIISSATTNLPTVEPVTTHGPHPLIQHLQSVNFMLQLPFSPPLTPTIDQNFNLPASSFVASTQNLASPNSFVSN